MFTGRGGDVSGSSVFKVEHHNDRFGVPKSMTQCGSWVSGLSTFPYGAGAVEPRWTFPVIHGSSLGAFSGRRVALTCHEQWNHLRKFGEFQRRSPDTVRHKTLG